MVVDPNLLSCQTINNSIANSGLVLRKLSRCENLCIEDDELIDHYEKCYAENYSYLRIPSSSELSLANTILSDLVLSANKPAKRIVVSNSQFSDKVRKAIGALVGIHRKLVEAACQTDDVIVVISDNSLNCQSKPPLDVRSQLATLLGRDVILYASEFIRPAPRLRTEGKTDWKHLKAALRGLRENKKFIGLQVAFDEYEDEMGDGRLLAMCKSAPDVDKHRDEDIPCEITVCVFDRDQENTVKQVSNASNNHGYKKWRRDWFSFALPVPPHRSDAAAKFYLCIEFYYQDSEIKLKDNHGRRLFVSTEFDSAGEIKSENVKCTNGRNNSSKPLIIDTGVESICNGKESICDTKRKSVALTKDDFAKYVLNCERPFHEIQFSAFSRIFEVVETIVHENFP